MTTPVAIEPNPDLPCPKCGGPTQFAYAIDGPGTRPGRICVSGICSWRGRLDETKQTNATTPDGPHYRTALQAVAGERINYMAAEDLECARAHVWNARAGGGRAWIQVTSDLGLTWKDCADDGTEVASGA